MRKAGFVLGAFAVAFAIGAIWPVFSDQTLEAKPYICKLAVEPFLYCEPSNRCKDGEQFCYVCQGVEPSGAPCLCSRVGCMVP